MKFEIENRWDGSLIFECEAANWKIAISLALKAKADLRYANLRSADLRYANLSSANLSYADLSYANLRSANLRSADLSSANLSSADLRYANLSYADLRSADLSSADLRYANLSYADLRYADLRSADLRSADLRYANLSYADLRSADLRYANLSYAENSKLAIAMTRILPEGDIIGWKKCIAGVIVKLLVPKRAKRCHAFGRKCRAEYIKVISVIGAPSGVSQHNGRTEYKKGKYVRCDKWDDDFTNECSGGIHFFITREEAEAY